MVKRNLIGYRKIRLRKRIFLLLWPRELISCECGMLRTCVGCNTEVEFFEKLLVIYFVIRCLVKSANQCDFLSEWCCWCRGGVHLCCIVRRIDYLISFVRSVLVLLLLFALCNLITMMLIVVMMLMAMCSKMLVIKVIMLFGLKLYLKFTAKKYFTEFWQYFFSLNEFCDWDSNHRDHVMLAMVLLFSDIFRYFLVIQKSMWNMCFTLYRC